MDLQTFLNDWLSPDAIERLKGRTISTDYWTATLDRDIEYARETLELAIPIRHLILDADWNNAESFAENVANEFRQVDDFDRNTTPLGNLAAPLTNAGDNLRRITGQLRPHVHGDKAVLALQSQQVAETLASLTASKEQLDVIREQAESALLAAQKTAADKATSSIVASFTTAAKSHAKASKWWLGFTLGAMALLVGMGIWLLFVLNPPGSETTSEAIREGIIKVTVITALGFAVAFCARNYRANMHMKTSYELRSTIVNTAQSLQESVDPEARPAVINAVVVSVFALGETGYSGSVPTSDPTAMSALLAVARQAPANKAPE